MNILVTGGAGYLGSTLVPRLLAAGHNVAVYDCLRWGIAPLLPLFRHPGFSFERGDIRDHRALADFAQDADAIVHLAAIVGYPSCARAPDEARSVNIEGTRNVAAVAGRSRPVIFASTSSVYGAVQSALCAEDTPARPLSLYGETKLAGEDILLEACAAVVCRIATVYGLSPRLRLDLLINDFVYRALHERLLRVYEGHARRSFLHVADVAGAVLLALEKHAAMTGRVFNVGDETQNFTKLDVCRLIARRVPGVEIETCEGRDTDQRDYAVSYERVRAQGFQCALSLEEGIGELCAALKWIDK